MGVFLPTAFAEERTESAGCLIKRDGKVLVLKHQDDKLGFPGGKREFEESSQQAAVRETFEEVGVRVKVQRELHQFDDGYTLFFCEPIIPLEDKIKVPESGRDEVDKIRFKKCKKLKKKEWRAPERIKVVREVCKNL
jgi:8-oxo-dGTP pyrophosphatase MutT (NUDIX family)